MLKTTNKELPSNLELHEYPIEGEDFKAMVIEGLTKQQKELSPRFFYDQRGSDLFAEITRQEEYYLTRTEYQILEHHARDIHQQTRGQTIIIEPGAGNNEKVTTLLKILPQATCFIPIEISRDHLLENSLILADNFPKLHIVAVASDYMNPELKVDSLIPGYQNPLIFFPGSSIGNYGKDKAVNLLKQFVHLMRGNGKLLIGVDLKKDPRILEAAYNDSNGITEAFNLNALHHIKNVLNIENLNPSNFTHKAWYNSAEGRVEMHLVSRSDHCFQIDDTIIRFRAGESIHTENSYKYTIPEFRELAARAGLTAQTYWTDPDDLYSLQLFSYQA